jgi:single-strand DNA-binding protein
MSRGLNKLQIIGRLGRDPEMRSTGEGKWVTNFSVATGGSWTDSNGNQRDDTEWFRVEAWDRLAETCNNYLHKGDQVYIEGRIKSRKYTDSNGVERTSVDVVASNMIILSNRNNNNNAGSNSGGYSDDYYDEAPAAPARQPARAAAPQQRGPAPSAAPQRAPAARPTRNAPQPIDDEDDIPF